MTIIPPVPPIVPDVVNFARPGNIIPIVTPFTYRDGITFLEFLESLNTYVTLTLVPFVNQSFDALEDKWGEEAEAIVVAVNAALAAQATAINTALANQQTNVQNALDAQQAHVDDQLADNLEAMANLTTFVNQQVTALTNYVNSIEFQDSNVHTIVADVDSATRLLLDSLYGGGGGVVDDADIAALVQSKTSETRGALDDLYAEAPALRKFRAFLAASNNRFEGDVAVLGYRAASGSKTANLADTGFCAALASTLQAAAPLGVPFARPALVASGDNFKSDGGVGKPGIRVINFTKFDAATVNEYYRTADLQAYVTDVSKPGWVYVHMMSDLAIEKDATPAQAVAAFTAAVTQINTWYGAATKPQPLHILVHGPYDHNEFAGTVNIDTYTDAFKTYCDANPETIIMVDASDIFEYQQEMSPNLNVGAPPLSVTALSLIMGRIVDVCKIPAAAQPVWEFADSGYRSYQLGPVELHDRPIPGGGVLKWRDKNSAGKVWAFDNGISMGPSAAESSDNYLYACVEDTGLIYGQLVAVMDVANSANMEAGLYLTTSTYPSDTSADDFRYEFVRSAADATRKTWLLRRYEANAVAETVTVVLSSLYANGETLVGIRATPDSIIGSVGGIDVVSAPWSIPSVGQVGLRQKLLANSVATGSYAHFRNVGYRA